MTWEAEAPPRRQGANGEPENQDIVVVGVAVEVIIAQEFEAIIMTIQTNQKKPRTQLYQSLVR